MEGFCFCIFLVFKRSAGGTCLFLLFKSPADVPCAFRTLPLPFDFVPLLPRLPPTFLWAGGDAWYPAPLLLPTIGLGVNGSLIVYNTFHVSDAVEPSR